MTLKQFAQGCIPTQFSLLMAAICRGESLNLEAYEDSVQFSGNGRRSVASLPQYQTPFSCVERRKRTWFESNKNEDKKPKMFCCWLPRWLRQIDFDRLLHCKKQSDVALLCVS